MLSERRFALGAFTLGAVSIAKVALQLVLLPVMARLLGPGEFGIYALALPTISFVSLFVDGGLGATLSREPEDATLVWSSAFWMLLLTGCLFAVGTSSFGAVLGYLVVGQQRLPGMIALLSLSLIFQVVAVPPVARLSRRRNLGVLAVAELSGSVVGAITAILLAIRGEGAWSLVLQYVAGSFIRSVVVNLAAFELPRLEFSFGVVRPHLVSGGLLIGSRLSEYAGRASENIGIETFFGTSLLGTYTFATQISKFAAEALGNVTWTTLYVQALTSEAEKVVELYRRLCRLLASVLFPGSALVMVAAPELVDLLLGSRWSGLAFFLRMFLPASSLVIIATQVGALLLARDRFIIQFWCSTGMAVARVAVVFAGPWLGLQGTIFGLVIISLVYSAALVVLSSAATAFALLPLLRGMVGPLLSSASAAVVCRIVLERSPESGVVMLFALASGAIAFLASMLLVDRRSLVEDWSFVVRLARRSQKPSDLGVASPLVNPVSSDEFPL